MNIIKWAKEKQLVKKAKNKKIRKQLNKNMPKIAKRPDVMGTIARRKEQHRKLLKEISK